MQAGRLGQDRLRARLVAGRAGRDCWVRDVSAPPIGENTGGASDWAWISGVAAPLAAIAAPAVCSRASASRYRSSSALEPFSTYERTAVC